MSVQHRVEDAGHVVALFVADTGSVASGRRDVPDQRLLAGSGGRLARRNRPRLCACSSVDNGEMDVEAVKSGSFGGQRRKFSTVDDS